MTVLEIRNSKDPLALAQAWRTAISKRSHGKKNPEGEGYKNAIQEIHAIEDRLMELRRELTSGQSGLHGSSNLNETFAQLHGSKAEIRILENQIETLKEDKRRLEKYRDQAEELKDKTRDLERDIRDLEHQISKRSTIQEIGELLKDEQIREVGLGLLSGSSEGKGGLKGLETGAKKELYQWLQQCPEDEAAMIHFMLVLASDQNPFSAEFNQEVGELIMKHKTKFEENK